MKQDIMKAAIESWKSDEMNEELFPSYTIVDKTTKEETELFNGMNTYCAGFYEGRKEMYSKEDVVDFALFYYGTQGTAEYLGEDLFKVWERKRDGST